MCISYSYLCIILLQPGTAKVIYAIGSSDPVGELFSNLQQHGQNKKGARSLNLLNYVKNRPIEAGAKHFDIIHKNVRFSVRLYMLGVANYI